MRKKRDSKYTTIKDVAREAEVSIATVSRVMNNGIVKEDKKKRVLEAIKKLNYVPNDSARNLASVFNTKNIYLLVPNINSNYYWDLVKGFKTVLKIYSYNSTIEFYNYGEKSDKEYLEENRLSSEFKCFVQLGQEIEVDNKIVVNWGSEFIKYDVANSYGGLCFYSSDEELKNFLKSKVFLDAVDYEDKKDAEHYLAFTLDEAIKLYNSGIRQTIYTFERAEEISKICPNIQTLKFDFFGLGLTLARIAMKKIREEEITNVVFNIGG